MAQVVAALLEERRALVVRHVGGCHCGAVHFEVEAPEELEAYECNCSMCGVKSFYLPRSNPDGYSVNVRCPDPDTIRSLKIMSFDGRNWEEAASQLRGLSRETRAADEGSS